MGKSVTFYGRIQKDGKIQIPRITLDAEPNLVAGQLVNVTMELVKKEDK
jgi:hypothetical protein